MTNRILIEERTERINEDLKDLNSLLVPYVQSIIGEYLKLELGDCDKGVLNDILNSLDDRILDKYLAKTKSDLECAGITSRSAVAKLVEESAKDLKPLRNVVEKKDDYYLSKVIHKLDNVCIKDNKAYISDEVKDRIVESHRYYATGDKEIEVYNAQKSFVDSVNQLAKLSPLFKRKMLHSDILGEMYTLDGNGLAVCNALDYARMLKKD